MDEQNIGKEMADCFDKMIDKITKTPIADRLEASLKYDVINGDSFERSVLTSQIQEAVNVLRRMVVPIPTSIIPVTEHPDVQRLIGQVAELQIKFHELQDENVELQDKNERLSKRDCNATVQILLPTADSPFNKEDCRIVDVGYSDNIYVVECDAVVELQAENERLKNDKLKPCVTCDAFQRIDRLEEVLKRMLLLKCDDKCEDEHGLSETIYFVPRSMIAEALKGQTNDDD